MEDFYTVKTKAQKFQSCELKYIRARIGLGLGLF